MAPGDVLHSAVEEERTLRVLGLFFIIAVTWFHFWYWLCIVRWNKDSSVKM